MKLQLNKNKRIGRVIFFVEGDEDEPSLLRSIFCDVLGYNVIVRDKRNKAVKEYGKKSDAFSKVFVVPVPYPAIKKLPVEQDVMDEIYSVLSKHGLASDEASTFYLFDRDYQSNTSRHVESKIALLKNPLDNGPEMPGAFLISYPCLQAYYCQAHGDGICFPESKDAKKHVNVNNLKSLSEEKVMVACGAMLSCLENIRGKKFDPEELDDYSVINNAVFSFEEDKRFHRDGEFLTLSLLSLALLDLGILEIKE